MAVAGVANAEVERCLREILLSERYSLSPQRTYGENDVDIIAERNGKKWHIEVIGYKKSGPARAKDFYEAFFRAVSRLNDGAEHCVIALASQAKVGLPARASHHRVAWGRIARIFPELQIWLVDISNRKYKSTVWGDWLHSGDC